MTETEDETTRPAAGRARTFVRLLAFLRPYRASLVVSSLLAIGSQVAGILVPVLTGVVIDELSGDPDTTVLAFEIAAVVGLGLLRGALMLGRRLISGRQALAVEYDLRDELYGHFLRLSFGFYDRSQTGQLMSRATIDLQSVRFFLGYGLIFFAQHVVTIVVVSAVLFVYSWQLALVALAITPIVVLVAYRYSQVSHPVLRDVQQQLAEVATVAEESIAGVHVVKSFSQEERPGRPLLRGGGRGLRPHARREPAARVLRAPADVPPARRAGGGAAAGRTHGRLRLPLDRRLLRVQPPARNARDAAPHARHVGGPGPARDRRGRADLRDLDEPEEIADVPSARSFPPGPGAVVFEDVDFGYEPGRPVLESVDLEIAPGRTVALIGRTARARRRSPRSCPLLRGDRGARARRRRRRARARAAVAASARSA